MNLQRLSFDAMPPLSVPFRFFATAPFFAIIASLLFLFADSFELSSRWSNLILSTTHGFTLGFMLMVMLGALFQILPVVLGVSMPKTKPLSQFVYYALLIGILSLIAGLYLVNHYLLSASVICLALALTGFLGGFLLAVIGMSSTSSSWSIRLACLSLLITVCLGLSFVVAWIEPGLFANFRLFTNVHLLWGFIGWTLLLVMGVSFQIIPMFYVTPDYPKWLTKFLPAVIFFQLILISLFYSVTQVKLFSLILLTLTSSVFPVYTLYLINQRKRKAQDITIWFWKTAMSGYLISAVLFLIILFYQGAYLAQLEILFSATLLIGFAIALITGMLLKIMPFLVWLNLQQAWIKSPSKKMPLSNMQEVIPNAIAKRQYRLFAVMLVLILTLLAGFQPPWMIKLVAFSMLINFGYLFFNLLKAKRLYNRLAIELESQS